MLNLRLGLFFCLFVVRHVNKPHSQKGEKFYLQECMQTLMVDPVGIGTTCVCMPASQKTVYSTCAGQANMSKTKSKRSKETVPLKKEKETPLGSKSSGGMQYPVIYCTSIIYKIKKQMLPFCEGR